jgi:hypothetical protein
MTQLTEDEQVRVALRLVTSPVVSSPDLLLEVRHRIRRTSVRRRVQRFGVGGFAIAMMAMTAVMLNAGVTMTATGPGLAAAANHVLLSGPTGGDLAADTGFTTQVMSTWTAWQQGGANGHYDDGTQLTEQMHLAWAGTTPAGDAAIGVQATVQTGLAVTYFLAGSAGAVTVQGTGPIRTPGRTLGGVIIGTERKVLLSLDVGQPMEYASSRSVAPDGHVSWRFASVHYRDGAAIIAVPTGPKAHEMRFQRVGLASDEDQVYVLNQPVSPYESDDRRLAWNGVFSVNEGLPTPSFDSLERRFNDALYAAGYTDPGQGAEMESGWYAYGRLTDSTEMITGEYQLDDVSRVFAVLLVPGGSPVVVFGGVVNREVDLPVKVRLPDGRGWVVVRADTTITWRIAGPGIQDTGVGHDAALLPGGHELQLRLDTGGTAPKQVSLPA